MEEPKLGWTTEVYITRVIDGDTVEVELRKHLRIRLLDVWAPETRTKDKEEKIDGLKVKQKAETLLPVGSKVVLFIPTAEKEIKDILTLNRVLGKIFVNGKDICEILSGYIKNEM